MDVQQWESHVEMNTELLNKYISILTAENSDSNESRM